MRTSRPDREALTSVVAVASVTAAALAFGSAAGQENTGVRSADVTEIAPFRLTGVEGFVRGGYWSDSDKYSSGGLGGTDQTLSNATGKVFVMTHSYVYHPNFLTLDLGAGPVFFRNGFSSESFDGASSRWDYDASTRATFLRDKPYRGSVFYDRLNDSQAIGPAQSLVTRNTRYGFDLGLLAPVTPVPMRLDGSRFRSQGLGSSQVIDEEIDELNFRADRSWGRRGDTTLRYQAVADDSSSGSLGLPILRTRSRTNRADLDTMLTFGEERQNVLTNTISYYDIKFDSGPSRLADDSLFRFDVFYRAQPTASLQTRVRYQFDAVDQSGQGVGQSGNLNSISAGATWQPRTNFSLTGDALATTNRSTAFDSDAIGLAGSANYTHALPVGELVANYATAWFKRDQAAKEPVAPVVGERLVLTGLTFVALRRTQVVPGSVVVSNSTRTQTYLEGVDYALRVIGVTTEIQRLVAGAILDGQEVLVDYSFETGGTFGVTEFNNTIDLAWRLQQVLSVYGRFTDVSARLDSGVPTSPLNPAREVLLGVRSDLPFDLLSEHLTAGALAEWVDRDEVISPYARTLFDAYLETSVPLIPRSGLRFGLRQQKTEYVLTPSQDVTQRALTLRFWSRFRSGLTLYIDGMSNRDYGSPQVERKYLQGSARAQWRIRQLLMSAEYYVTRQEQGGTENTHTRAQFDIRRDF